MIVHETLAICEGCEQRAMLPDGATAHPSTWPALIDESGQHHYCSHACLVQSATGTDSPGNPSRRSYPLGLVYRDVQMIEQIAMGKSNKEVATAMGLVESTVKNRLTQINFKLGAEDRMQAVLRAHVIGVINLNTLAQRVVPLYDKAAA